MLSSGLNIKFDFIFPSRNKICLHKPQCFKFQSVFGTFCYTAKTANTIFSYYTVFNCSHRTIFSAFSAIYTFIVSFDFNAYSCSFRRNEICVKILTGMFSFGCFRMFELFNKGKKSFEIKVIWFGKETVSARNANTTDEFSGRDFYSIFNYISVRFSSVSCGKSNVFGFEFFKKIRNRVGKILAINGENYKCGFGAS